VDRDIGKLPPEEQAKRFLAFARDARAEAAKSTGTIRVSLLQIAEQWEMLAKEIERLTKPPPV
jgi:hypothetical protein